MIINHWETPLSTCVFISCSCVYPCTSNWSLPVFSSAPPFALHPAPIMRPPLAWPSSPAMNALSTPCVRHIEPVRRIHGCTRRNNTRILIAFSKCCPRTKAILLHHSPIKVVNFAFAFIQLHAFLSAVTASILLFLIVSAISPILSFAQFLFIFYKIFNIIYKYN